MRSFPRQTLVLLLLAPLSHAQQDSGHHQWTERENRGLRGPVHTQRVTSKSLAADPRKQPAIYIPRDTAWVVFDVAGRIVELANGYSDDGTITGVSRLMRNQSGQVVETLSVTGDVVSRQRTEFKSGPHGPVEEVNISDGKVGTHSETEYDERGNIVEQRTYDASGRRVVRASSRHDAEGRTTEWKVVGPGNHLDIHIRDRYGVGGLAAREWYDAAGRMVRSVAVRNGELTSWWQAADCACEGNIGFVHHNRESVAYFFRSDGSLNTEVASHPGRYGNIEPDEVRLYDASRNLLERVIYRYERDRFGNWTSRLVSVWSPETGEVLAIRQDARVLTYHH